MSKVTVIFMGTNDPARQNQRIDVAEGATVRTALANAGVPTESVSVNVNRAPGKLDQTVGANDVITVTQTNLKGAAIDFSEILKFGTAEATVADNVLAKAIQAKAEKGAEAHVQIVGELLETLEDCARTANARMAAAEKEIVLAKTEVAELAYASKQLENGNIFSLLGHAGLKGYAKNYCDRMGCAVPANNSSVWATSAPKAE